MTIHSNASTNWIPFLANQYDDLNKLIISYWGRKEVERAVSAESPYRTHRIIAAAFRQFNREDQACIEEGFTENIVELFRENNLSLWRLPVFNLTEYTNDIASLEKQENMPAGTSIARFKNSCGCSGIVLHAIDQGNGSSTSIPDYNLTAICICSRKNDNDTHEFRSIRVIVNIQETISERHIMCLDSTNRFDFYIKSIVSNTHPRFKIREIPQIEQSFPIKVPQAIHIEDNPIQPIQHREEYSFWTVCILALNATIQYIQEICSAIYVYFSNIFHIKTLDKNT